MKLFMIFFLSRIASNFCTIIPTQSGIVTGTTVKYKHILLNRFLGIPFAEAPTGELRFKKTVPVKYRLTPINANSYPPACLQYFPYDYPWVDNAPGQSEDCLYLNIWAPKTSNPLNLKAVMFWIFPGGYSYGSNRKPIYDGSVLAAEGDVIVVTINYRLGLYGFLSTDSEDAPGNMGLFDALEALKWVNNNIRAFGGDTNRITAFGESAGSVITGLFTISPLTRGLFQQIIMESASPVHNRGDTFKKNLKLGQKLAETVGCASNVSTIETNPQEVVECLRGKDAMDLIVTVNSFNPSSTNSFVPIYGDEFLPKNPLEEIRGGNFRSFRTLIGSVKDEGSFSLASFKIEVFGAFGEKNPQINKSYAEDLILERFKDLEYRNDIADYYLGNLKEDDYDAIRSQTYHAFGDFRHYCPVLYFAESMANKESPVYYFYFTHRPSNTPWAKWMGVAHYDEVSFVFGRPLDSSNYTRKERRLSKSMVTMWTEFAKFGVPSQDWQQFSKSNPYAKLLRISSEPDDYLQSHFDNCNFFREYYGF